MYLLATGHFALEEDDDAIASHIKRFLSQQQKRLAVEPAMTGDGIHPNSIQPKYSVFK